MRLRNTPSTTVKSPAIRIWPFSSMAIERTVPLAPEPGSKPESTVPSSLSRAMKLRATPLTRVKPPPMSTRPSFCTATAYTPLATPTAAPTKFVSGVPSTFSRAMFVAASPPSESKKPPMTTLPVWGPLV